MKTITASVLKKRIKGKKILDAELFVSNDDHFKRAIPRNLMLSFNL
jgi:hypothetical protein